MDINQLPLIKVFQPATRQTAYLILGGFVVALVLTLLVIIATGGAAIVPAAVGWAAFLAGAWSRQFAQQQASPAQQNGSMRHAEQMATTDTPEPHRPPTHPITPLAKDKANTDQKPLIDHVLQNTYDWVKTHTDASLFYIGLYDRHRDLVEFPLVMQGSNALNWEPHTINGDHFMRQVLTQRETLRITRGQGQYDIVFNDLPDSPAYQEAIGVPLTINTKVIGLMTLINPKQASLNMSALESVAAQAGLAIRNTNLYNHNTQIAYNLNLINQSVQDVMFNLDGESAMLAACKTAIKITQAQRAAIFLMDQNDRDVIRLAQNLGLTDAHTHLYTDPAYLPQIERVEPRILVNVWADSEDAQLRRLADAGEFSAMAEVIMRSGNITIGLLTVFHDAPHHYDRAQLELLETLAYQVSAALDNAELLSALEVYASEQAQLVHLSSISTASLDLPIIHERVTVMLQQMLSVSRVYVGLLAPNGQTVHLHGQGTMAQLHLHELPELANIFQQKQPMPYVYYLKEATITPAIRAYMEQNQVAMVAILPMLVDKKAIGMIMLADREPLYFSDSEWRFVEMATNQIATQIHNAQLYADTQSALKRRLQQLALIEDIARQISRSLDLDGLIRNVLEAGLQATQAQLAVLGLSTDKGGYRIIGLVNEDGHQRAFHRSAYGLPGLMAQVMLTGEQLNIADNTTIDDYTPIESGKPYASSLVLPLLTDTGPIGVLNLESTQPAHFDDERLEFGQNLAGHAVISIQNARLLEARQGQIETLNELRHLSIELANQVERTPVFNGLLKTALTVLNGHQAVLYQVEDSEIIPIKGFQAEGDRLQKVTVTIPQVVLTDVMRNGEIHTYPNCTTHPLFNDAAIVDQINYGALIIAPIHRGGKIHEVLAVTMQHTYHDLALERDRIDLLTIQIGGHLENVALYDRIRANNNQMRAILDSTRDGILLLDSQGRLIDANISAESMLNISLEDYSRQDFAAIMMDMAHSDEQADLADSGLMHFARDLRLQSQNIKRHAFQLRTGGQVRYLESVGSPVLDAYNGVMGRLLTMRDVTEERLLEEWREEVTHMLVHDLREPLGSVIGSIHFAVDLLTQTADENGVGQLLEISLNSAEKLYELVQTILDIYKMENDRLPLELKPTSILDIVVDTVNTLQANAQEGNLTIEHNIPADTPILHIDSGLIERVVRNLIGNAIRHTPQDGTILVAVDPQPVQDMVLLRVANTGNPIPPEQAEAIFEKFRQVENAPPVRGHKGSGVGLAFCKQAIEAHGGKIWVEANGPLSGASFVISLPILTDDNLTDPA